MDVILDPQRQAIASTPGLFLLNPSGNRKFVTGEASRIGNSTVMSIIAALFILGAISVGYYFGSKVLHADQAERSGTTTNAEIMDGHSSTGSKGGTSYYITYQFRVNGQSYKKEIQVGQTLYNNTYIGDTITIKYLPSDPNFSVLTGQVKDDTERNNSIIAMAILIPICLIIAAIILWVDGKNRRISGGQLLPGQIVGIQGRAGSKGAYNVTVEYTFANPYGQQITKKQTLSRPDLRRSVLLGAGTPVAVLYVDDKAVRLM